MLYYFVISLNWPVSNVNINKQGDNLSASEIIDVISIEVDQGWFGLSLQNINYAVQQLVWVDSVDVSRSFPDVLVLNVVEKQAIARWNSRHLLSSKGKVFVANTSTESLDLPLIEADIADATDVFSALELMQQQLPLSDKLPDRVTLLKLAFPGGWDVVFDNYLLVRFGGGDFADLWLKFKDYYPQIIASKKDKLPRIVDMHYAKGAAVKY